MHKDPVATTQNIIPLRIHFHRFSITRNCYRTPSKDGPLRRDHVKLYVSNYANAELENFLQRPRTIGDNLFTTPSSLGSVHYALIKLCCFNGQLDCDFYCQLSRGRNYLRSVLVRKRKKLVARILKFDTLY